MTDPPRRAGSLASRREVIGGAGLALVAGACGTVTDDDAGRKSVEWFENELSRIGYSRRDDGTWATPRRKVTIAARGDQLEMEIRAVHVKGTRPAVLDAKASDQSTTWRGQVHLRYESRDRYFRDGTPLEWSNWVDAVSVLNVERRGGRWYVQRVT